MSDTTQSTAVAVVPRASDQLAAFLGIEKGMMIETLKAQCFKGKRPDEVSDAQLAAFVSTANVLKVNPLVPGMLYAYPERNGGITPILGPDGTFKKLDEQIAEGKLAGFECDVTCDKDGKPIKADAVIYRGGDAKPAKYTAWFSEWCVTSNPNWQTRPRHMLWVRAIKQCARQVIHGLPMDADEYEIAQMQNVTGTGDAPADVTPRPTPKPRAKKGAAAVEENPPIDVPTTPAPQTEDPEKALFPDADAAKAHQAAQALKSEPKQPETTPEPAKPAESPVTATPRAFLKDGEVLETTVEATEIIPFVANVAQADGSKKPTPSLKIHLKGGFVGEVMHIGGGIEQDGKIVPVQPWAVGKPVALKLAGKLNKTTAKVAVRVESVAEVAEEF